MKFPLKERPFDSVQLSPARVAALERTAERVIDASLDEFHDFIHARNRVMPKDQYKPVKKRDNITIYKELTSPSERRFGPVEPPSKDPHAPFLLNKLVTVGTVRGRMDDMLLGTAVRGPASVVAKTSFVKDEFVDCSLLHEMQGASPQDPFRFVALKWIVKSKSVGINTVVLPRDMIVLQSSGLLASEGIGYHMLHSVDAAVPECPPLEEKYGILRSRISAMFFFRQLAPDVIEVYGTTYVEPNGSAPESVVLMTSVKTMGVAWKSLDYSHHIKLSWILKNKAAYMGVSGPQGEAINTPDGCELCNKRASFTDRLGDCALCEARVCSRCRVTKKLSTVNRRLELRVDKVDFCKTCLIRVVNEDAVRIAAEMNVGVPITPWHKPSDPTHRTFSSTGSSSDTRSRPGHRDTVSMTSTWSGRMTADLDREASSLPDHNVLGGASFTDSSLGGMESDYDEEEGDSESTTTFEQQYRAAAARQRKRELFAQYQRQLQVIDDAQTEQTQIAVYKRSSSARRLAPQSETQAAWATQAAAPRRWQDSEVDVDSLHGPTTDPAQEHFRRLYAQMRSLQQAAERTFEMTRNNERNVSYANQRSTGNYDKYSAGYRD